MIRPIETVYDGHRFRSRLEARWAVFFNTLRIKYEYEKEGFDLDGTRYLPDFWLPEQKCWIEIKGQTPTTEEYKRCELLADLTRFDVFILFGDIPNPDDLPEQLNEQENFKNMCHWFSTDWLGEGAGIAHYSHCFWSDCDCEKLAIRHHNFGGGWCCECSPGANPLSLRLYGAYLKARQARFEYGEKGK
jgi:hypothetical protein